MILQVLPGRCSSEVWLPCGARVGDGPDAHFVGVKFDVEGLSPRRDIEGDAVTNPLPKQVFTESRTCPSAIEDAEGEAVSQVTAPELQVADPARSLPLLTRGIHRDG